MYFNPLYRNLAIEVFTMHAFISSLQLGEMIHCLENTLIDSLRTRQADLLKTGTKTIVHMRIQPFQQPYVYLHLGPFFLVNA